MYAVLTTPAEVSLVGTFCSPTFSCTIYGLSVCRFERLKLKCLSEPIAAKYAEILNNFGREVDRIQKVLCYSNVAINTAISSVPPCTAVPGAAPEPTLVLQHASHERQDLMESAADAPSGGDNEPAEGQGGFPFAIC